MPLITQRLAEALQRLSLPAAVRMCPWGAYWFLCNCQRLADIANREGMHANALAITRQCLEAMSIIELGLSGVEGSEVMLEKWNHADESPGSIRKWLEQNVWHRYSSGLWSEPWAEFTGKLCRAVQPYAHYSGNLALWQTRVHNFEDKGDDKYVEGLVEFGPCVYDPQKAIRITLYHALLGFTLGRICLSRISDDAELEHSVDRLRVALSKSVYLDGSQTNWDAQFWAVLWFTNGDQCPE